MLSHLFPPLPPPRVTTGLSPLAFTRPASNSFGYSPVPTVAHWHIHVTSTLADGGVLRGTDLLFSGNIPQTCRNLLWEGLARLGVQHQRPHGHGSGYLQQLDRVSPTTSTSSGVHWRTHSRIPPLPSYLPAHRPPLASRECAAARCSRTPTRRSHEPSRLANTLQSRPRLAEGGDRPGPHACDAADSSRAGQPGATHSALKRILQLGWWRNTRGSTAGGVQAAPEGGCLGRRMAMPPSPQPSTQPGRTGQDWPSDCGRSHLRERGATCR